VIVFRVSMLKRTQLYSGVRMVVNLMYFYPYPCRESKNMRNCRLNPEHLCFCLLLGLSRIRGLMIFSFQVSFKPGLDGERER